MTINHKIRWWCQEGTPEPQDRGHVRAFVTKDGTALEGYTHSANRTHSDGSREDSGNTGPRLAGPRKLRSDVFPFIGASLSFSTTCETVVTRLRLGAPVTGWLANCLHDIARRRCRGVGEPLGQREST